MSETPQPSPPSPPAPAPPPPDPSTNGSPPGAMQPPATGKPAEPTPEQRADALEKATKRAALESMKRAESFKKQREEVEAEKAKVAADRAELETWKKEQADRKRNPAKYLERDFGKEWFDTINRIRLEGGKATPDLVASELDERVGSVEAKMQKEIDALKAERIAEKAEAKQKEAQTWRQNWEAETLGQIEKAQDKYKLLTTFMKDKDFGDGIKRDLMSVFEAHFNETQKTDEETGEPLPGQLLTADEGADRMEKKLKAIYGLMQKTLSPTPPTASSDTKPRRSLTTDLSATQTSNRPPPTTDAERMKRALAKFDEIEAAKRAQRQ